MSYTRSLPHRFPLIVMWNLQNRTTKRPITCFYSKWYQHLAKRSHTPKFSFGLALQPEGDTRTRSAYDTEKGHASMRRDPWVAVAVATAGAGAGGGKQQRAPLCDRLARDNSNWKYLFLSLVLCVDMQRDSAWPKLIESVQHLWTCRQVMHTIQYDVSLCQTRRENSRMRWSNKGMSRMNEMNNP